jgi:hypothetical protein
VRPLSKNIASSSRTSLSNSSVELDSVNFASSASSSQYSVSAASFSQMATCEMKSSWIARDWKTKCLTLLDPFANQGTKLKEQVDRFSQAGGTKPNVQHCLGILEAFRDDFDKGFLDDLLWLPGHIFAENHIHRGNFT